MSADKLRHPLDILDTIEVWEDVVKRDREEAIEAIMEFRQEKDQYLKGALKERAMKTIRTLKRSASILREQRENLEESSEAFFEWHKQNELERRKEVLKGAVDIWELVQIDYGTELLVEAKVYEDKTTAKGPSVKQLDEIGAVYLANPNEDISGVLSPSDLDDIYEQVKKRIEE